MDIRTLLASLRDHKVRFMVIGAWAFPAHGYARMTQDIGMFIDATAANADRTMRALRSIGYDVVGDTDVKTFQTKKVLLRQYILQTDIHPFVKGVTFEKAWSEKTRTVIEGMRVYVPLLNHLIGMKRAAGRDKDKADLRVLCEIQRQKKRTDQ